MVITIMRSYGLWGLQSGSRSARSTVYGVGVSDSIQLKRATRPRCLLTDASCAVTPGKVQPHAGNSSMGCLSVSRHSVPSDDCIPDKQHVSVCVRYLYRGCRSLARGWEWERWQQCLPWTSSSQTRGSNLPR
jgi:hypothetical protein